MKNIVKFFLVVLCSLFATTPDAVSNTVSPFVMSDQGIDPSQSTAQDLFREINTLEDFEGKASEFVTPAWLEILVLVSPANYPISTFLTQKVLDGVRGLAKAQSATGSHKDILIKTEKGDSRFNSKYYTKADNMSNWKQFSDEKVKNYKLNWGDIAVIPFQDATNGTFAGGAVTGTLPVANADMWKPSHQLKVQETDYATGEELVVYVESVDPANDQIVIRSIADNGNEVLPAIVSGTQITRMGNANDELAVKNESITQSPASEYNYAQKFITSVVYSNYMMMTQLFTNYSFSMVTNLALQDFRYGQEFTFMFGIRSSFTNTAGKRIYATGGLTQFVDQEIEYGVSAADNTITETDIVDFTEEMRVGNNGSDTRYLFAGSKLINALNKGVMSDSTRFVQKDFDTVYGLSFTVLYSFFGTINVMYAPLLDQSDYINKGFLLDMAYVDKFVFMPFRETHTNLWELRESDAQSVDMVEACGLVVRNVNTHFIFVQAS